MLPRINFAQSIALLAISAVFGLPRAVHSQEVFFRPTIVDSSLAGDCKAVGDIDRDGFKDLVLGGPQPKPETPGDETPESDVAGDSSPRGEEGEPGRLADGTSEDKHVPYARFQEVNEQHKATQGELASAQKELAALKKSAERMKPYERDARLEAWERRHRGDG